MIEDVSYEGFFDLDGNFIDGVFIFKNEMVVKVTKKPNY